MARGEAAFRMSLDLADCEIFVLQRLTGAGYNDISRDTAITPAQWKSKTAAGERFVYSEPQVS
ncbi:MAG: hypothetical protein DBX55_02625 [Verrucomicrobia bacterium]|nr:MAG: hypothetical protein DBX55_02625 [Verrucomicrobiota bacterium]